MQWCGEKIELLINFSSQNTFLFGVQLSDYHIRTKRAASRSSAIVNFDAINQLQFFFVPDAIGTENWRQNLASNLWRRFLERVYEALALPFKRSNVNFYSALSWCITKAIRYGPCVTHSI